ncbi:desulfoferrodoxin [Candidatus Calescamantes bacterium]|nr:desulfoferrodoxin [Candidatus Calescamantes bacterium]
MGKRREIFRCNVCGQIIDVLNCGQGQLVCCDQPMEKLTEQTADSTTEKHVPIVEQRDGKTYVKVGSVPHPMDEKHYIKWVEVQFEDGFAIKFLKPGEAPEKEFPFNMNEITKAREYCSIHNLWASDSDLTNK